MHVLWLCWAEIGDHAWADSVFSDIAASLPDALGLAGLPDRGHAAWHWRYPAESVSVAEVRRGMHRDHSSATVLYRRDQGHRDVPRLEGANSRHS